MKVKHLLSDEEKIYKTSTILVGILSFLCSFFFVGLTKRHEIRLPMMISKFIFLFGIITTVLLFSSLKTKCLRFTSLILLSIFIATIGSFQQMNISILFIIPIFIAYSLQNRVKIYSILLMDIILFNASRIFKSYNIWVVNPHVFNFKMVLTSNLISSFLESFVFLAITIPVFLLLVKQNLGLRKALDEKNEATNDILQFCSTATSFHNKYLSVHIKGVRDITKIILDGLIEEGVYIEPYYYEQIVFSVQFHDIGKIYIDSSILDKKGKLDVEEFKLIKEHPARGLELFNLLPKNVLDENYIQTCKNVIFQHHERLDGSGYPTGTKDISFEAKIVAIADVVDALLSWRPYKPPLEWERVVEILEDQKSGFNYECIKVVYQQKEKILAVSNENNRELKFLLSLMDEDIVRH